jgi:hypothetical protein
MSYKYDWIENNIIVTFEGDVRYKDIFNVDGKIFGDSRFDLMTYAIYDFSLVSNFNITVDDVKIFSALNQSASMWNRCLKFACITQDKAITDAVSDFMNLLKESNWKIKIFGKLEDAIEWVKKDE